MSRQSEFQTAILDAARPAPTGLHDGQGRSATRRFAVYRNNVAVSLTEALETAFPATKRLLGDDNFRALAGRFLRQSPPDSPLMMHYGAGFADFLNRIEALSSMAYLPDIARLEQALRRAYHAADATPISPEALAKVPAETLPNLRFSFAPAISLISSDWPIHDIYQYALKPEAPKPRAEAQTILVSRNGFDPMPHLVPPGGKTVLNALIQGETLGVAADLNPDFNLSQGLSLLLKAGAITSFNT
jgi:hypothetical protein